MENYRELAKLCASLRRAHNIAEPADKPIIAHAIKYYNDKLKEIDSAVGRYYGPDGDYKPNLKNNCNKSKLRKFLDKKFETDYGDYISIALAGMVIGLLIAKCFFV